MGSPVRSLLDAFNAVAGTVDPDGDDPMSSGGSHQLPSVVRARLASTASSGGGGSFGRSPSMERLFPIAVSAYSADIAAGRGSSENTASDHAATAGRAETASETASADISPEALNGTFAAAKNKIDTPRPSAKVFPTKETA